MASLSDGVPPLREIYLYITGSCNLNCRHCWIDPVFSGKIEKYLPWSDLKGILEEAQDIGLGAVKVTGGEPFLHPQMVEILYGIKAMGLGLRMETNGTLIGPREARALKDNEVSFSISIDGPDAELHDDLRGVKGSFKRTLKGTEHIRAEGLSFQVIMSLHRGNLHGLVDMVDFVQDLGATSLKINPITLSGRADEMKERGELLTVAETLDAYHALKQHPSVQDGFLLAFDVPPAFVDFHEIGQRGFGTCGILGILGVLHDGRAGLCGIGEHVKELDFGSLLEPGAVRRIWEETETLHQIRERVPTGLKGICSRCMMRNYCLGKCVANTFTTTGDLFEGFPFCEQAFSEGLFPENRLVEFAVHAH